MECTACRSLQAEHESLPREALPLSILFESADAGCLRCLVIKDAIMKWTGMSEPERFVLLLRLGDDMNREPGRAEVELGLHVIIWEPGKGEDYAAGFCIYTDNGE
jgi:hypothetical protein